MSPWPDLFCFRLRKTRFVSSRDLVIAAQSDVLIFGAGVIGLSLALELRFRGSSVVVLDPRQPLSQASTAAAGMLAVEDPHNSAELLPLSRLSGSLYAAFLSRVKALSSLDVPFQTQVTKQTMPDGSVRRLAEHSLDPRQLAPALLAAVLASGARVLTGSLAGQAEKELRATSSAAVHTTGAWDARSLHLTPRKGQMLRVTIPPGLRLDVVHRNEHVYVVPRTLGPQAGTALLGATLEDAGFDTSTSPADLRALRRSAAVLVPELGDESTAPMVEAWAGLRPATPDGLPVLGRLHTPHPANTSSEAPRHYVAGGHFRNGILLAPATAVVLADLLEGRPPRVDLQPFEPSRFGRSSVR